MKGLRYREGCKERKQKIRVEIKVRLLVISYFIVYLIWYLIFDGGNICMIKIIGIYWLI
jgi:hypothetical protein